MNDLYDGIAPGHVSRIKALSGKKEDFYVEKRKYKEPKSCKHNGKANRKLSDKDRRDIYNSWLLKELTIEQLMEKYNVVHSTICYTLDIVAGMKVDKTHITGHRTVDRKEVIRLFISENLTYKQIAKKLKISQSGVWLALKNSSLKTDVYSEDEMLQPLNPIDYIAKMNSWEDVKAELV